MDIRGLIFKGDLKEEEGEGKGKGKGKGEGDGEGEKVEREDFKEVGMINLIEGDGLAFVI